MVFDISFGRTTEKVGIALFEVYERVGICHFGQ